ncbi:MAG: hypothetical protein QM688_06195 [Sphingomonas bacterium]
MRCDWPAIARFAGAAGLAAAPLHAAMPVDGRANGEVMIGICGQPGLGVRIPFAPGKAPARDDDPWGCHGCAARKRGGDICACGENDTPD